MADSGRKLSQQVQVINDLGLHARSAAKIAAIARNATAGVWLSRNREKVDARSIVDILTLACEKGSDLTIGIDDYNDRNILNRIVELVRSGFGE